MRLVCAKAIAVLAAQPVLLTFLVYLKVYTSAYPACFLYHFAQNNVMKYMQKAWFEVRLCNDVHAFLVLLRDR